MVNIIQFLKNLIGKFCKYTALFFIFTYYFRPISLISLFILSLLLVLAINPQGVVGCLIKLLTTNIHNNHCNLYNLSSLVRFFSFILVSSMFLISCMYRKLCIVSCNRSYLSLFLTKDVIKIWEIEKGVGVKYEEVYLIDKDILQEEGKRLLAWIPDPDDPKNNEFINKIFIFYALRKNKFLVLLAFPEVIFIPFALTLSQNGTLFFIFLSCFVGTLLIKLEQLKKDVIFIQSSFVYKYKNYVFSIKYISSDVRDMFRDIREEKFGSILGVVRIIFNN